MYLNIKFVAVLILLILLMGLGGCAQRKSPAPVTSIEKTKIQTTKKKYLTNKKNSFKDRKWYKVKKGETLYAIAWRAGQDYRYLAKINNISKDYVIYSGQLLKLTGTVKASQNRPQKQNKSSSNQVKKSTGPTNKVNKTVVRRTQEEYGRKRDTKNNQLKVTEKKKFSNKIRGWKWPVGGKITRKFSSAAQGYKGIDIVGRKGMNVVAAAGGKVVYAGSALRGYGNLVIIKHNEDYLSAYAHNDRILVKEREYVKAGQLIAEMGKTGTDSVKLRFEVRYRGKSVNPEKYLPKR
nr:peptidoglycan DD-metalloendopeptidase family protein [Algicola sagamiensis]